MGLSQDLKATVYTYQSWSDATLRPLMEEQDRLMTRLDTVQHKAHAAAQHVKWLDPADSKIHITRVVESAHEYMTHSACLQPRRGFALPVMTDDVPKLDLVIRMFARWLTFMHFKAETIHHHACLRRIVSGAPLNLSPVA